MTRTPYYDFIYSAELNFSITVFNDEQTGHFNAAIKNEDVYSVAISHSKKANLQLKKWFDNTRIKFEKGSIEYWKSFNKIIENENNFELIKNSKKAYKEYILLMRHNLKYYSKKKGKQVIENHRLISDFPFKSFDLMLDFYSSLLQKEIESYYKNSNDSLSEFIKNEVENHLLDMLIEEVSDELKKRKNKTLVSKSKLIRKKAVQPLNLFYKWLIDKKELLSYSKSDEGALVDLSEASAVEKIIYLKELGIIDVLLNNEPFNTSTNRLAQILSAITGELQTTLQPYLYAMLSNPDSNKNPFNSRKPLNKVHGKLIDIGFNLNKSK